MFDHSCCLLSKNRRRVDVVVEVCTGTWPSEGKSSFVQTVPHTLSVYFHLWMTLSWRMIFRLLCMDHYYSDVVVVVEYSPEPYPTICAIN